MGILKPHIVEADESWMDLTPLSMEDTLMLWYDMGIKPVQPYLFELMNKKDTINLIEDCVELANNNTARDKRKR